MRVSTKIIHENITLQDIKNWLKNHGSACDPFETILLQLACGETDIDEFRTSIIKGKITLN